MGPAITELPHVGLGTSYTAVEVDRVESLILALHGNTYFHGFGLLEGSWLTPHCDDTVGILTSVAGGEIPPQKGLYWVLIRRDEFAIRDFDVMEDPQATKPVSPVSVSMIHTLDPEAEHSFACRFFHVDPKKDNIRSSDRMN
jgi:hypothetical protein